MRFKKLMKERFLNRIEVISLSAYILILSAHVLIVFEKRISLSAQTLILSAHALIAFENPIRLRARTLILSAHALIVFENRISLSTRTLILSARPLIAFTLPRETAFSPAVPSGDTPCLTAGNARRANRRQRKPPTPAVSHSNSTSARLSYPLHAFSATPPASGSE